jgi:hypothetical protein
VVGENGFLVALQMHAENLPDNGRWRALFIVKRWAELLMAI